MSAWLVGKVIWSGLFLADEHDRGPIFDVVMIVSQLCHVVEWIGITLCAVGFGLFIFGRPAPIEPEPVGQWARIRQLSLRQKGILLLAALICAGALVSFGTIVLYGLSYNRY